MIGAWTFRRELARWSVAGRSLPLWWRDDDAREPDPALDRLLGLAHRHGAPLTLAVIPDGDRSALGARLALEHQVGERPVSVIQHGVDHFNVSPAGAPSTEFEAHCTRYQMAGRLVAARSRIAGLPGFVPVFAPPWNAVHPDLPTALLAGGFIGLSAQGDGDGKPVGLPRMNVHLDLMRWRGGARFRGADAFLARAARLARARRRTGRWDQPIGLLTHHLDHDEAAWRFLDRFLGQTTQSDAVRWLGIGDLAAAG